MNYISKKWVCNFFNYQVQITKYFCYVSIKSTVCICFVKFCKNLSKGTVLLHNWKQLGTEPHVNYFLSQLVTVPQVLTALHNQTFFLFSFITQILKYSMFYMLSTWEPRCESKNFVLSLGAQNPTLPGHQPEHVCACEGAARATHW